MLYDVFTTFDWHFALLTWSDVLDETKWCYFFWIEISSLRHMRLGVSSGWCLCVSSTLQEQDQTSIARGREYLKDVDTSHFPFVWLSCILLWNCHHLQLSIMSYCNIAEWLHNSVLLLSKLNQSTWLLFMDCHSVLEMLSHLKSSRQTEIGDISTYWLLSTPTATKLNYFSKSRRVDCQIDNFFLFLNLWKLLWEI